MKIEKVKADPRPKPHTKTLRFRDESEEDQRLLRQLNAAIARSGLAGEPFIKLVLETALNDPKFVLKVPAK